MKRIGIFFNSPYLGGAERSIIHQSKIISDQYHFVFFIPELAGQDSNNIEKLISKNFPNPEILKVPYPSALFAVSRFGGRLNFIHLIISLFQILQALNRLNLHSFDKLWCNGNKIATVVGVWATLSKFQGEFIWHFRDYPSLSKKFKFIWKFFTKRRSFKFSTVANSNSVKNAVRSALPSTHITHHMVYNPSGEPIVKRKIEKIQTIGIVSMLAPWKGIHQIILWASLFEQELKSIGINDISIYGANIYQTGGAHLDYAAQLQKLLKQFPSTLIKFRGNHPPEIIYETIDLLIHPVISAEPFGRILMEAFTAEIPVISTALGGSGELALNNNTALIFPCYDYAGLTRSIRKIATDIKMRNELVNRASLKAIEVEKQVLTLQTKL